VVVQFLLHYIWHESALKSNHWLLITKWDSFPKWIKSHSPYGIEPKWKGATNYKPATWNIWSCRPLHLSHTVIYVSCYLDPTIFFEIVVTLLLQSMNPFLGKVHAENDKMIQIPINFL
jgi:hypothetical protein